jgi:hypothetical protein
MPTPTPAASDSELSEACRRFLDALKGRYRVHAVKSYRVQLGLTDPLPVIPCLDHEARLHGIFPRHVSVYVEEIDTGELHEVAFYPRTRRLVVDLTSTMGESSPASQERLRSFLREAYPGWHLGGSRPSWLRGDLRAIQAVRAQVTLRDVLLGKDLDRVDAGLERLRAVAAMMEKESRVASWGVRTAATPILAGAGIVLYFAMGAFAELLSAEWTVALRGSLIAVLGSALFYVGLKAVQLTEIGNRVWKRATEYELILDERKKRGAGS